MTASRPESSPPAWRIADIARYLSNNTRNTITYYDTGGLPCTRSFPEVLDDALRAIALLRRRGCLLRGGSRCAIAGSPGYPWLVAAVACIICETEIVAIPESLEESEIDSSVAGLQIDFAVIESRFSRRRPWVRILSVQLDTFLSDISKEPPDAVPGHPGLFSIVAFTSGSTSSAKLKTFRLESGATEAFIDAFARLFDFTNDEEWVVCHSFSHIVHLEYVLGGLCWGYNITLADPMRLLLNGKHMSPSVLVSVPGVYEQLLNLIQHRIPSSGPRRALIEKLFEQPLDETTRQMARELQPVLIPEVRQIIGARLKVMIIGAAPSSQALRRLLVLCGLPVYEGYGMSETNMISCNTPGRVREGTVGPVWPGVDLRCTGDNVVQVRLNHRRTSKYLNTSAHESERTFREDGWIDTGDLGEIEDGFLRIIGRVKELIITDRGKKINPGPIQTELSVLSGIAHAIIVGDNKPFLIAVLAPRDLHNVPDRQLIGTRLKALNETLAPHERIRDFILLEEPLTEANGLLTRSGKPRRAFIERAVAAEVAQIYQRTPAAG